MIKEFISFATAVSSVDEKQIETIRKIVHMLSKEVKNAELIIAIKDYDNCNKWVKDYSLSKIELSIENVQVKFVSTYKMTKTYAFKNVAWQAAIGDKLVYIDHLSLLINQPEYFDFIINQLKNMDKHIYWLRSQYLYDLFSFKKQPKKLLGVIDGSFSKLCDEVNRSYDKEIIDQRVIGYIVDRFAINASFNNQKEQYDPFLCLATCGLEAGELNESLESEIKSGQNLKQENIEELQQYHRDLPQKTSYQYKDTKELLVYYTHKGFMSLIFKEAFVCLIILLFICIFSSTLAILIGVAILPYIVTQHIFIATRQTFAAANDKNIVGHFEIHKM